LTQFLGYEIYGGYSHVAGEIDDPETIERYEKIPFITDIVKLKKFDKMIDIIFTHRDCPIITVLNFHSSIVMNFFTGSSLVCIYPETTGQDVSIKTRGFDTFSDNNTTREKDAFEKYASRGVTFMDCNKSFDGSDRYHHCERDPICPHTLRYIDDEFCCTWRLNEDDETLDAMVSTTWHRGGQSCFEENRGMDALLVAGKGFVLQERGFNVYITAYTR
jgi:hypothetical protein